MGSYRCVSKHGEDLDHGQVLDPGEFVDLTDDQVRLPRAEQLLADGLLIGVDDDSVHQAKLAAHRFAGEAEKQDEALEAASAPNVVDPEPAAAPRRGAK